VAEREVVLLRFAAWGDNWPLVGIEATDDEDDIAALGLASGLLDG